MFLALRTLGLILIAYFFIFLTSGSIEDDGFGFARAFLNIGLYVAVSLAGFVFIYRIGEETRFYKLTALIILILLSYLLNNYASGNQIAKWKSERYIKELEADYNIKLIEPNWERISYYHYKSSGYLFIYDHSKGAFKVLNKGGGVKDEMTLNQIANRFGITDIKTIGLSIHTGPSHFYKQSGKLEFGKFPMDNPVIQLSGKYYRLSVDDNGKIVLIGQ